MRKPATSRDCSGPRSIAPIRAIAERWGVDARPLHNAYALARQEFKAALLEVVAFHQPGSPVELEEEAASLLKALFLIFLDFFRAKIASALILGKQLPVDTELRAMNEPHDSNETIDASSAPADSLDAGLAAGFGRRVEGPASILSALGSTLGCVRPVLLKEAQGESALVVRPGSDAMPLKDETGDRYQLSGEIARGGMGAVLRGRDVDLGRDLAVKVLLEKYVDRPEVARRFIEEAQIGGQLQHPGVVPVYDIGRFGDRPFFTMKLVKGQTLSALLAERTEAAEDRPRLLGIALQVAQAMAYAHAKGVIHRDLKPANIMVGAFGEVQVMDWGLAKVLAEGGVADEEARAGPIRLPRT